MTSWKYWILIGLSLLPWFYFESRMAVNADAVWLSMAAQRALSGLRMTDAYYDPDPPLCYLIYLPVALLAKAGIPLWRGVFIYTVCVMAISWTLTARLLRSWPELNPPRYWGLVASYIIASSFPAIYSMGQKDHLIAIALLPFLIAQYGLKRDGYGSEWLKRMAIIWGVPFILVKPHYGLLPVVMLARRFMRERRWSVVFDFDCAALAFGVFAYAMVIILFFSDFLTEGLGVSLKFYVNVVNDIIYSMAAGLILTASSLAVLAWAADAKDKARPAALFFVLMGVTVIIPIVAQAKGFSVHMLPAVAILIPAAFLVASLYFPILARSVILNTAALFAFAYVSMPPNPAAPTHQKTLEMPLTQYMVAHASGSSFYMQTGGTNIVYPLSAYTGIPHASRFPAPWFLAGLYNDRDRPDIAALQAKLSGDIAEDFAKYKPAVVALYADPVPQENFVAILGGDPAFDREWAHYAKAGRITLRMEDYYPGLHLKTVKQAFFWPNYDIYLRKD